MPSNLIICPTCEARVPLPDGGPDLDRPLHCPVCGTVLSAARSTAAPSDPPRPAARDWERPSAVAPESVRDAHPAEEPPRSVRRRAMPTSEDRTVAMLCHWGLIGLIVWLINKGKSRYVDHHGREAVNFMITMMFASLACWVGAFALALFTCGALGFLVLPFAGLLTLFSLIMIIVASIQAFQGNWFRYPVSIHFLSEPRSAGPRTWGSDPATVSASGAPGEYEAFATDREASSSGMPVWVWVMGGVMVVVLLFIGLGAVTFSLLVRGRMEQFRQIQAAVDEAQKAQHRQADMMPRPQPAPVMEPLPRELAPPGEPVPVVSSIPASRTPSLPPAVVHHETNPIDQALADLRSGDSFRQRGALDRLARMTPRADRRDDVVKQVEPMLDESDVWVQRAAVRPLEVWGGSDCVRTLVKLLDHPNSMVRSAVFGLSAGSSPPLVPRRWPHDSLPDPIDGRPVVR